MLLSLVRINAANTSGMNNSDLITVELLYLQDQKSLTLCCRSFQSIVHSIYAAIGNCYPCDLSISVVFPSDRDSSLWQSRAQ